MPFTPINQYTTTPQSSNPATFATEMDIKVLEDKTRVNEMNALATEMNLYATYGPGAALAPSGFKNKIIGGDFTLNPWQRGTSFAAPAAGAYVADRWSYSVVGTVVHTISKAIDAPTALQAGYFSQHCLSVAVTTADAAIAAGDLCILKQKIEGLNAASLGFGQAGTRSFTLSFWVKGAKTGVHCVSFRNSALDRSYVATYSIIAINTWEYKSITINADTAGTWLYDTGVGLDIGFALAAGTTFQTTANTWVAGSFLATSAQVNELDTVGNTFKLALVQLEDNGIATAFESRSFSQEGGLCGWYVTKVRAAIGFKADAATEVASCSVPLAMRAAPTITNINSVNLVNNSGVTYNDIGATGFRFAASATAVGAVIAVQDLLCVSEI